MRSLDRDRGPPRSDRERMAAHLRTRPGSRMVCRDKRLSRTPVARLDRCSRHGRGQSIGRSVISLARLASRGSPGPGAVAVLRDLRGDGAISLCPAGAMPYAGGGHRTRERRLHPAPSGAGGVARPSGRRRGGYRSWPAGRPTSASTSPSTQNSTISSARGPGRTSSSWVHPRTATPTTASGPLRLALT